MSILRNIAHRNPTPQARTGQAGNSKSSYVLSAAIVLFQVAMLLAWEQFGRDLLLRHLASNPDALDREFYTQVAQGMRYAMAIVLLLTIVAIVPSVRSWRNAMLEFPRLFPWTLIVSVSLQLVIIAVLNTPPFSDAAFYVEHAQRLLGTGSYVDANGNLTAFWPVGYPAVLAGLGLITGDMLFAGRLLNVAANLALIVISYRLFSPMLSPRGRGVFLLLLALHPIVLLSSVVLMTEQLFLVLLWGAVYIIFRMKNDWRRINLVSVLMGLAAYIRPSALFYALAIALYLGWSSRKYSHAVVMLLLVAVMLAPWTIRNLEVFGRFVPVATNGGFNFLMGNHNAAGGGLNYDFDYKPQGLNEAAASSEAMQRGVRDLAANPAHAFLLLPKKLFHAYRRSDAAVIWSLKPVHTTIPGTVTALALYVSNGLHYLMLPFVIIGLIRLRRDPHWRSTRPLLLLLYAMTLGIILIFFGSDRFVLPMLPLHVFLFVTFISPTHE